MIPAPFILAQTTALEPPQIQASAMDLTLMFVIAIVLPALDLWLYPKFVKTVSDPQPRSARSRFYLTGISIQWIAVACVAGNWVACGRPWSSLGLGVPSTLRIGVGITITAGYLWLMLRQRRVILSRPNGHELIRRMVGNGAALIPRTTLEGRLFVGLAFTAGICEEFLYRGMLSFWFSEWGGPIAGLVVSSIAFGFAHLYLASKDLVRTSITGAILWLFAFASGSIVPVIIIHAAMDLIAGDMGSRALRPDAAPGDSVVGEESSGESSV